MQGARLTRIDQTTRKATIDWQGFSVAPGETVDFHRPYMTSVTRNRVVGNAGT